MNKIVLSVLILALSLGVFSGLFGQTYTQDFSATFPPSGWALTNAGSGNNWSLYSSGWFDDYAYNGDYCMQYEYDSADAANAWAFTQGVTMTAGNTYRIEFRQRVRSSSYPENMKVTVGNAQTVAAQGTTLLDLPGLTNTSYSNRVSANFTPASSGTYFFGFNCYSAADMHTLYIDNVRIYETVNPNYAYTVTPTLITAALNAGDSVTYTITVTNTGLQPLQITGLSDTADWLTYSVSLPQTVTTGNSFSFPVTVDATGLYKGLWSAYLTVETDSPLTPSRQVEIDLSVSTAGMSLPVNPRMVAEWELARGVGITWDYYNGGNTQGYKFGIPNALIQALSQQLPLFVGCPSGQQDECADYLANLGVNNYSFITATTDTYWVRDYGPWAIYEGDARGNRTLNLVDFRYNRVRPDDDLVGDVLADYFSRYKYDLPMIHTGGNIMTDGNGTAMSTNLVLNDNDGTPTVAGVTPAYNYTQGQIQGLFEDYLGVTDYHIYQDPLVDINDTVDHMDLWCKLLDVDIVLIKRVDPSHEDYAAIETAAELWNRTTSYGGPFHFRVFRVDTPTITTGAGGDAPYCNSIIVNNTIYVPQMGGSYAAADAAALEVYRQAMPAYTVVGFTGKSSDPWLSTDAIHCRVNTIWDPEMIHVWHVPLYGEVQVGQDIPIDVTITSFHPLADSTYVTYRFWDASEGVYTDWVTLPLVNTGGNDWSAVIPGANIANGDSVFYAIRATDSTGRVHNERLNGRYDPFVLVARRIDTLIVRAVDLEGNALPGYEIFLDGVDTGEVTYHTFTATPGQLAGSYFLAAPPAGYEWLVTPQSVSASDFTQANNYTVTLTFTLVPEGYLPIELSSFTAMISVDNFVNLTWVTQSETNVQGFYVLRNSTADLSTAATISGLIQATNTSQQQTYIYKDTDLYEDGEYFYWLQNSDMDGSTDFFGPVSISYSQSGGNAPAIPLVTELKAIYPNPFNPIAYLPYDIATTANVRFDIYNARGQLVRTFDLGSKAPGRYKLEWDGTDASGRSCGTGLYHVRMTVGKDSYLRKAVLIK